MDRVRDQLLAGSVLARDQDAAVGRGDAADVLDQRGDRGAGADDAEIGLAVVRPAAAELRDPDRLRHDLEQPLAIGGFLDEVERPALPGLDRVRDRRLARHHDHAGVGRDLADPGERVEPVHARHREVEQHRVDATPAQQLERAVAGLGLDHGMAGMFEHRAQRVADRGIVVDHQHIQAGLPGHDRSFTVSCPRNSLAFGRRCIPPCYVAPPRRIFRIRLRRRALPGGRSGILGATTNFWDRTLAH